MKKVIFYLVLMFYAGILLNAAEAADFLNRDEVNAYTENNIGWDHANPAINRHISTYAMDKSVANNEPPIAPDGLTGNFDTLNLKVELSWNDNSENEEGFIIERAENGGLFDTLSINEANITSYIDDPLQYNNTYQYKVYATNANGNSGFSNIYELTTPENSSTPIFVGYKTIFDVHVFSPYTRAQQITIPSDGQIVSITMYHGGSSGSLLYGVYSDVSDNPVNLLATTNITAGSEVMGWQEVSLTSPLDVNRDQKVWLAWVFQQGAELYFTKGTPGRAHSYDLFSDSLPEVFNTNSFADSIYSIFAKLMLQPGSQPNVLVNNTVESGNQSLTLYPNPVQENLFYISVSPNISDEQNVHIDILDLTGKIVQSEFRTGETLADPIVLKKDLMRKHLIFVRVTTHDQVWVQKLLLK
jgi:hypothetical protein